MALQVSSTVVGRLVAEAACAHPLECCGILLGDDNSITALRPSSNVHPRPATHFEIDPQTLVDAHRKARQGGPQVIGYYHSHPNGRVAPSATDRAMASEDGAIWAIIAAGGVTFWRAGDGGFTALPYVACDR